MFAWLPTASWHSHKTRDTRSPSYNFVFNTFFTISPKRQPAATKNCKVNVSIFICIFLYLYLYSFLPAWTVIITNRRAMAQSMKTVCERDNTHN